MELNEFTKKVCDAMKKKFGEECRIELQEVTKNNGVVLHGLLIISEEKNMIPTIYLDSFWEAYENGVTFAEIISRLSEVYRRESRSKQIDMEFFREFERVKNRICYRLIGRNANETLLKDIPHVDFLDLAICFYYSYQGLEIGEGSILVHNSHMEMWKTSEQELLALAEENTPRIFPGHVYSMEDALGDLFEENDDFHEFLRNVPMKVLSNHQKSQGAACLLYAGMLERVAQKYGESFYIFPSSIHEVILHPHTGARPVEYMKAMIREVNRTQVSPEEVLSDSLYYYDFKEKKIKIIF